jgi:hypothetical protein
VNFFFLGDYSPPPPCAVHSHKGPTGPALYSRTEKISYKKRWAAAVNDITFQLLFQRVTPPILSSDSIRVTHYIFIIYKTAQFHSKPKWNPLWSWCAWSPSSPLHLKSITLDDVSWFLKFYFSFNSLLEFDSTRGLSPFWVYVQVVKKFLFWRCLRDTTNSFSRS